LISQKGQIEVKFLRTTHNQGTLLIF